ncbi:hypothetical protein LGT39_14085 [Demequina sp. TTPB684]|uniref:hypothetical protein n=1 Tax=unclassified Demequina TaxID=2620311 RepID=UPI001CF3EAAE|nr:MULTISPECIES: hypothetical protein [unclassified Demequina]MCB2413976.1 hypothetical protein [Demequina sp. TTPB684]UPU88671.1 hypothetical protein LGT36_001745 [Demequina sp. TMPB413]
MNRALATGAFVLLLTGCGSEGTDLESPDSPVAHYDWNPQDGGMDALLEGTLELRDGCLVVNPTWDDADTAVLAVFPRSFAAWDNADSVLSYDGRDYEIGDFVWAGGGFVTAPTSAVIPASCESASEVFLIQTESLEPPEG